MTREFTDAGHSVVGVDLVEPEEIHEGLEFRRADIAQPEELREAFEGTDAIVHLAAIPEAGLASWGVTFAVNALGTVNCLEAAVAVGAERFVFASSEAVLGFAYREIDFAPDAFPLDESSPLIPQDSYGASKIAAEEACRAYTRSGALSTVCVRPCYCWGTELGEEATQSLEHPENHWRSLWVYIHLRDIARVYRLACEHPGIEHETFYAVADDIRSNVPTRQLVERFYPGTPVSDDLDEYGSLISNRRMREVLDFEPLIRWRDELDAADFPNTLDGDAGPGTR
ncbi:NAD(P)-dependent oxidoreductase [Thermoleophilia bacterium SCSIO 60948]|nr:NAD(P)-dependent oxidoreductase [Thermoleophilia bacterium SCSIO 60948]